MRILEDHTDKLRECMGGIGSAKKVNKLVEQLSKLQDTVTRLAAKSAAKQSIPPNQEAPDRAHRAGSRSPPRREGQFSAYRGRSPDAGSTRDRGRSQSPGTRAVRSTPGVTPPGVAVRIFDHLNSCQGGQHRCFGELLGQVPGFHNWASVCGRKRGGVCRFEHEGEGWNRTANLKSLKEVPGFPDIVPAINKQTMLSLLSLASDPCPTSPPARRYCAPPSHPPRHAN